MKGSGLIELDDDGAPISESVFIPVQTMPDVVPVSSIELPISDEAGIVFSEDETANLALTKMLRSMAELKGLDAENSQVCRRSMWQYMTVRVDRWTENRPGRPFSGVGSPSPWRYRMATAF